MAVENLISTNISDTLGWGEGVKWGWRGLVLGLDDLLVAAGDDCTQRTVACKDKFSSM